VELQCLETMVAQRVYGLVRGSMKTSMEAQLYMTDILLT